jgi:hypothetical protein
MLTVEILQLPPLGSFVPGEYPATELSQFPQVKVTLQLTVYRQSVRLGARPLEDHNQQFFN